MQNSNAPRRWLRGALIVLFALGFCAGASAQSDDVQEASKLLKAGQPQQALDRVNRALNTSPRDPQARFMKGLIFTELGRHAEAIDILIALL